MITTVLYILVFMLAAGMLIAATGIAHAASKDFGKYPIIAFVGFFCVAVPILEVIPVMMFDLLANGKHLAQDHPGVTK